jgi:hypothetical protein
MPIPESQKRLYEKCTSDAYLKSPCSATVSFAKRHIARLEADYPELKPKPKPKKKRGRPPKKSNFKKFDE